MLKAKETLESFGHEVVLPPTQVKDASGVLIPVGKYYEIRKTARPEETWVWDRKSELILDYFEKERSAEAILVLNCDKNNILGYIGGNTLMEMGIAFFLKKKIFLLNPVPELSYQEEILAMKPIIINGDLGKIS
jgi:hypothetical protein